MSDLISRQAAIDALDESIKQCDKALSSFEISMKDEYAVKVEKASLKHYRDILENLPSVQPERKKRKWYKPTGMMPPEYAGVYRCSECDEFAMRDWKTHKQELTDFCQNCGADMRGEQE